MSSKARRTLLGVAAVVAIAAPGAHARPFDSGQPVHPAHVATGSVGMEYGDLRVPDAQQQTGGHKSTAESQPVVSAPGGFDWISAAIGAVAATGLALVALVAIAPRRPTGRRAASA